MKNENPWPAFAESLARPQGFSWLFSQVATDWASPSQRLSMTALFETTEHMIEAAGSVAELRRRFPADGSPPSRKLHVTFHRATKDFFNAWYVAMEAQIRFATCYRNELQATIPPYRSVDKFLSWLMQRELPEREFIDAMLRGARIFRTVLTHSAELPAHDWMTCRESETCPFLVRLYGEGAVPKNAQQNETSMPGTWHIIAPNEWHVVLAFMLTLYSLFSVTTGYQMHTYGRDSERAQPSA